MAEDFEIVAENLRFPEGPVWMEDGSVIVVEIEAGRITRVLPDGRTEVVAAPGGGPNGLAVGPTAALYCCNNGGFEWSNAEGLLFPGKAASDYTTGRIERIDIATGKVERLYDRATASTCRGRTTSSSIRRAASGSPTSARSGTRASTTAGSIMRAPTDRRSSASSTGPT